MEPPATSLDQRACTSERRSAGKGFYRATRSKACHLADCEGMRVHFRSDVDGRIGETLPLATSTKLSAKAKPHCRTSAALTQEDAGRISPGCNFWHPRACT